MGKKVGITYDLRDDWVKSDKDPVDINAEFDSRKTLEDIIRAIESGGHRVVRIGNAHQLFQQITRLDVDIVFNICEGYKGRNRESQVPILLEMFNIPYVGSDALTLGMTLDKVVAKKMFVANGIPTPYFFEAKDVEAVKQKKDIPYPLIVKCVHEGTSKGLTNDSRVNDFDSLCRQVELMNETYKQPAIVEQFIRGTEFTVGVLGNDNPKATPVVQISMNGSVDLGDKFYTFEMVSSSNLRYVCPAKISPEMTKRLQDIAIKVYRCVGARDFGRVDFRVDEQGTPYVLEINPLPSLSLEDLFNLFPPTVGTTYEKTVNQVLEYALRRYGLSDKASDEEIEEWVKASSEAVSTSK